MNFGWLCRTRVDPRVQGQFFVAGWCTRHISDMREYDYGGGLFHPELRTFEA